MNFWNFSTISNCYKTSYKVSGKSSIHFHNLKRKFPLFYTNFLFVNSKLNVLIYDITNFTKVNHFLKKVKYLAFWLRLHSKSHCCQNQNNNKCWKKQKVLTYFCQKILGVLYQTEERFAFPEGTSAKVRVHFLGQQ